MIILWIQHNVHMVTNFSKNYVWNTKDQGNKKVLFARYDLKNLGYCDCSKYCNVISKFPELRPDMLPFRISFHMSTSQICIE